MNRNLLPFHPKRHLQTPPRLPELPVWSSLGGFPLLRDPQRLLPSPPFSPSPFPPLREQRPLPSLPSPSSHSRNPHITLFSPPDSSQPTIRILPADNNDDIDSDTSFLPRSSVLTIPSHRSKNQGVTNANWDRRSKLSATTRVRRRKRWDAFHALEGKRKHPAVIIPNFVDISDESESDPEPDSLLDGSGPDNDMNLFVDPHLNMDVNAEDQFYLIPDIDVGSSLNLDDLLNFANTTGTPPSRPRTLSSVLSHEGDTEEGIVLEATRFLPPVLQLPLPTQTVSSTVPGLVAPSIKEATQVAVTTFPTNMRISQPVATEKAMVGKKKRSPAELSRHQTSSSKKRHRTPNVSLRTNSGYHLKSFIELDQYEEGKQG